MVKVNERVGGACAVAVKQGLFVGTESPVIIGADGSPVHVPKHIVRTTTSTPLAELVQGDAGEVPSEIHQRAVANKSAAGFGPEVKVRIVCVGPYV